VILAGTLGGATLGLHLANQLADLEIHCLERLLARRDLGRGEHPRSLVGFVSWELGRIPRAGDRFGTSDPCFEVDDLDRQGIDKAMIGPATGGAPPVTLKS
jgi:CBS domain containing-hemolysin-like protein